MWTVFLLPISSSLTWIVLDKKEEKRMSEMQENPYLIELTDEDGETVTFEHLDTVQ